MEFHQTPAMQQDGSLLYLVVGGLPAAQVTVVHTGEVVVDERRSVDHLEGAGGGYDQILGPTHELAGGDAEDGADPLPTRKE